MYRCKNDSFFLVLKITHLQTLICVVINKGKIKFKKTNHASFLKLGKVPLLCCVDRKLKKLAKALEYEIISGVEIFHNCDKLLTMADNTLFILS